jgi:hypothetical protein
MPKSIVRLVAKQIEALDKGDENMVRKHFTARLRDKITADAIEAAQVDGQWLADTIWFK